MNSCLIRYDCEYVIKIIYIIGNLQNDVEQNFGQYLTTVNINKTIYLLLMIITTHQIQLKCNAKF
jgi:hypothetical protein